GEAGGEGVSSRGRAPSTFRTMRLSARPIVALARLPWPSALIPEFIPIARVIGPLTIRIGLPEQVVQRRPCSVAIGFSAASSAANTIGMYSGLQPAITALMATFSTVHGASFDGTCPTHTARFS